MLPDVAVIMVLPEAVAVANPRESAALLMAATELEALQVTDRVRFCVLESEYRPMAINCAVLPRARDELLGVTTIVCKVALVTVNNVELEIPPNVAVIVLLPAATDTANPREPPALLTTAAAELEELQVANAVMLYVEPSEYIPVATNGFVVPSAILGLIGLIAIDARVALLTASSVVPEKPPNVAVIVLLPAATEVANPFEPVALLMVATPMLADAQVANAVMSSTELSEYVPVAMSCAVNPTAIPGLTGVTAMETKVAFLTISVVVAEMLPDVAVIVLLPAATEVASP